MVDLQCGSTPASVQPARATHEPICSARPSASASPHRPTAGDPPKELVQLGFLRSATGMDSIREVIAFPKTGGGVDPLTDDPASITAQPRKESGIDAKPKQVDQA